MNYRFFLPNNNDVDFLTNRGDIGILVGASYSVTKRIDLGIEYCIGLTTIYSASGTIDSSNFTLNTKNQFGQIRLEYSLK
jgi:hypothetical protein